MVTATQPGASRKVWIRRTLVGIVIGLAWAGGYWAAKSARDRHPSHTLVVAEEALDFGEVWEDAAFVWELPLENRGDTDLRVVEFASSCGCLSVEPPSLEVPAGQTRKAQLKLDLSYNPRSAVRGTGLATEETGMTRRFSVKVGAKVQGAGGSVLPSIAWTVRGTVRPVLTVEPGAVNYGDTLVEGQRPETRKLRVTVHTPLRRLEVRCEPDLASVHLAQQKGEDSKYELTIQPRSDLKPGPLKCRIVLRPQASDGPLPRLTFPLDGRVLEDIQASPGAVQFAVCLVGKSVQQTLILRSWSGTSFEVDKVACDTANIAVEALKAESDVKEYRITQSITQLENQSGTIRFHIRPKGGAILVVPVRVSYLGVTE